MSAEGVPVAIVGGGFSGTMVAANLARRGVKSVVIEATDRSGQGAAYSTDEPAHLLNVRAGFMSAWPEDPGDFVDYSGADPQDFAERRQFGAYLRDILGAAVESGKVELVEDRAVGARFESGSWRVALESGRSVGADALVLATGNQPPAQLTAFTGASDRVIDNPWGERAKAAVADVAARDGEVLIVGTSLTMVDVALSLHSAGHRGRILALSRRGKIPLSGGKHDQIALEWEDLPEPRVRALAHWLRSQSALHGWRTAIDALRPHSHRLWQAMALREQRLFLRYGRPWWDIHRHRIAPQVAARVEEMKASGQLDVAAGRIVELRAGGDSIEAVIRKRGHDRPDPPRHFDYLFNCTGPLHDIARTDDPLLRDLLDRAMATPDPLGIGFALDERSRVEGSERLWALGSLSKGRYWEIIAVPDIRVQAASVAEDIATELGS